MRRRWYSLTCAWLSGCVLLVALDGATIPSATLPDRLTHAEFWALSAALSEPGESFISDNLVSNEMSFAQVIPEIKSWGLSGGAYLGVGPEQNFAYLEAIRARIGFIVDIRRDNLLQHLLYKALFDVSPDRASFVANLFSRTEVTKDVPTLSADGLMTALVKAPRRSRADEEGLVQLVARTLVSYRFPLSESDRVRIREIHQTFFHYGPEITYATTQLRRPIGPGSFANLMRQTDANGQELGFLATEEAYHFVRDLQRRNLVIPVVGNFAGPTAVRGIGRYLREREATVSAFYVSNVEDYLGREPSVPSNGDWRVFCE